MTKTERVQLLKDDLLEDKLSIDQVFEKHILHNQSFLFNNVLRNARIENDLKALISETFEVGQNEVIVVGSSMLGFSISPNKLFQLFDADFAITGREKDKSDLDLAIISNRLFNDLNISLYKFTNSFKAPWSQNEYYYEEALKKFDVSLHYKFFEYHTRGWFRPDMKPIGFEFCLNGSYEQLKNRIIQLTTRRPGIAIYKEEFFFKSYHLENLKKIQNVMKSEIL